MSDPMIGRGIKLFSFIFLLSICINGMTQASTRHFKTKVNSVGNNQVQIREVCRGACDGIQPRVVAEGGIDRRFCFRMNYAMQHKEGLWKYYNEDGTLRDSAFYYRNWSLRNIDFTNPDGSRVVYNVVKVGPSKIEYYHKDGYKTEEQTFNLSDKKIIVTKVFFDKKGQVIRTEKWDGKKRIE